MDRLWAPWRMGYIVNNSKDHTSCFLCEARKQNDDRKNYVLYRGRHSYVIMNLYPYNNGHVMVAPRRHVATPELLTRDERAALGELVSACVRLLRPVLEPAGFNLGANLGRTAGAGFADHLHWHVVPRWDGDNNFMPALASTRVLSQSLLDSYAQLSPVFKAIASELS